MTQCQNTKRKLYITRKKTIAYLQANIERSKNSNFVKQLSYLTI